MKFSPDSFATAYQKRERDVHRENHFFIYSLLLSTELLKKKKKRISIVVKCLKHRKQYKVSLYRVKSGKS